MHSLHKESQSVGDEQAPRLAPEKHDFAATYTLGATMRQITYYWESQSVSQSVGRSFSVYVSSVGVSVSVTVAL